MKEGLYSVRLLVSDDLKLFSSSILPWWQKRKLQYCRFANESAVYDFGAS